MKRSCAVLEPWSTKEKLCLSSAVLRSGDQNWMSVSRVLRVFGEQDRPSEWYSQKQCALQYELLLNNANASKRKKRNEKGVETVDTPNESIVRKLLEDRIEELHQLLEEDKREFIRIKKDIDDIESGKADDRLDELEKEIEEEKEREAMKGSILRQHGEQSRIDTSYIESSENNNLEQLENKVPTSPLLTSLLQSPSHFRGATSIHSLLTPNHRLNDAPTLSRLLESPAKQLEPKTLFTTSIKKEPLEEEISAVTKADQTPEEYLSSSVVVEETQTNESAAEDTKTESTLEREEVPSVEENAVEFSEADSALPVQELEIEVSAVTESDHITPELTSEARSEEEQEQSSLNNLQDSDTMEEQHSITEFDRQMVNLIVVGTGLISVNHDTSSEHIEVTSSDIQHKDDSEATENSQEGRVSSVVEIDEDINVEGAVLEVGGEIVNLGGAVVVEEEVDTTVHEVELLVSDLNTSPSSSSKCVEEEDSIQDEESKEQVDSPETESQVEDEGDTPTTCNDENETEDKDEEVRSEVNIGLQQISRNITGLDVEDDSEIIKQPTKKRLISSSDSKPSSPASQVLEDSKEYRSWKKSIMLVFNRMATHKYASIFLRPITNEQAPAYDSVIQRPVDLSTIKKRIEAGELRTTVEFQRDLLLMFQNAIMYNNCRTRVFEMANIMQNECMQHIELMVEAMGEGVPWRKDPVAVDKLHTRGRGEVPKRKRVSVEDGKAAVTPKRRKETST